MEKINKLLLLLLSCFLIFVIVSVYDYKKPHCAGAACIDFFDTMETQSCGTGMCDKCGYRSCSMSSRANQACGLTYVAIGDLGGGSDRATCTMQNNARLEATTSADGRADCNGACVNFY